MKKPERRGRRTVLSLNSITDTEQRQIVENRFYAMQAQRRIAIEKGRAAARSALAVQSAQAEAQIAFLDLLDAAGNADDSMELMLTEPNWMAYRDADGVIKFECPFAEEDMINAMRISKNNLDKQANDVNLDDDFYTDGDEK